MKRLQGTSKTVYGATARTVATKEKDCVCVPEPGFEWMQGGEDGGEQPASSANYWPCPRSTTVLIKLGKIEKEFKYTGNKKGSGGTISGPSDSTGAYTVKTDGNNPVLGEPRMVLDCNCGNSAGEGSADSNIFDVVITIDQPAGDGWATATVTGTAMADTGFLGRPIGKQEINGSSKVKQHGGNSTAGDAYSITVPATIAGKPEKLTITWRPDC